MMILKLWNNKLEINKTFTIVKVLEVIVKHMLSKYLAKEIKIYLII